VVNVGSISASRASPGSIAYSTSKAAVEMLTKVMALELAPQGIRVNAVAPGVMLTGMTEQTRKDPGMWNTSCAACRSSAMASPPRSLGPFLASPLASYITATVLNVDGGYLAA
jgi:NAD(P)-dependent dehydrogenase (short-subunit alcohol dehydrogenase family)